MRPPTIVSRQRLERVLRITAETYSLTLAELRSKRKQREIAVPRMIAMFLAVENGGSRHWVGKLMTKDHSTVTSAVRRVSGWQDVYPDFKAELDALRTLISQRPGQTEPPTNGQNGHLISGYVDLLT